MIGNCFAQWIGHRGLRPASSCLHYYYYYYYIWCDVNIFIWKLCKLLSFSWLDAVRFFIACLSHRKRDNGTGCCCWYLLTASSRQASSPVITSQSIILQHVDWKHRGINTYCRIQNCSCNNSGDWFAQIRLHCGHLGPVVGGLAGLCLLVRRSSAAWSADTLYIAKPFAQALFHVQGRRHGFKSGGAIFLTPPPLFGQWGGQNIA